MPPRAALPRPAPLSPAGHVCVIAPAGGFAPAAYEAGAAWLRGRRLQVTDAPTVPVGPYYAGSRTARSAALAEALQAAPTALWAARGGSGSAQLLARVPELRLSALRGGAPWLIGFSDITALHARFGAAGLQSLHGANVLSLAGWSEAARLELLDLVGPTPPESRYVGDAAGPFASSAGLVGERTEATAARGVLVGGNLTVLASLVGTGVLPSWRGCLVLLEDIGEADYRLDRAFHQLWQAGHFDGATGFALGQFTQCGTADGECVPPLLAQSVGELGVPVVAGLPLGHDPGSRAILLGGWAALDAAAATLTVTP